FHAYLALLLFTRHASISTPFPVASHSLVDLCQPAAVHLQPLFLQPLLHPVGGSALPAWGGRKLLHNTDKRAFPAHGACATLTRRGLRACASCRAGLSGLAAGRIGGCH